jgi:hypothetical protein
MLAAAGSLAMPSCSTGCCFAGQHASFVQEEIVAIQKEIAMLRECNHPNIVKYYVSTAMML